MNKVDFRISGYFSWSIIFFGVVLAFIGFLVVFQQPVIGLVILLISLIVFTTHYRLTVDFSKKEYHDYVWILGLKNGVKGRFETIEYLFIKKNKVSQTMNLKSLSSTIRKDVYDGYLKFSDKDKIHLLTKDNKEGLLEKLRKISSSLNAKIIDYSDGDPIEI